MKCGGVRVVTPYARKVRLPPTAVNGIVQHFCCNALQRRGNFRTFKYPLNQPGLILAFRTGAGATDLWERVG